MAFAQPQSASYHNPANGSDQTLTLTSIQPSSSATTTIVAPGNGAQSYEVFYIDTRAFPAGGILNIQIKIAPDSATDGSFDLFPESVPIPMQGRPKGTLAGRYDIRKGTSTLLSYRFKTGQLFAFGLDGNWFSPKGAKGTVKFQASVQGSASQTPQGAKLKVLPIIYGPAYDPASKSVSVCIYVGARKPTDQTGAANFNWVQKVRTTDINPACPAAARNPGYKIDNCNSNPKDPDPSDPKGFPQSDLYRGLNAPAFSGASISNWIDPEDSKSFDYLFMDLPSRSFDGLFEEANQGGATFRQHTILLWDAILNPVRVDAEGVAGCAVQDKEQGKIGAIGPLYCKQAQITYGFKIRRAPLSAFQVRNLQIDLDPLILDGVQLAPAASYILSVSNTSYSFASTQPNGHVPMTYGTSTKRTTPVCQPTHVPKSAEGWRVPPQQEPQEFKKPFSP